MQTITKPWRKRCPIRLRYKWYSFCGKHRLARSDCLACQHGVWGSEISDTLDHLLYDNFPRLWLYRNNPHMSRRNRLSWLTKRV